MLSRFRRPQPYLLVALFALPAIWPFFHPGLPRSNDHLIHFYPVVELDRLVRAGVFFPRWAPDLVHGYDYPVFNFVFSLAHGIVEVFHLLGLNLLVAYKATLTLILLCSAWFAYRVPADWTRRTTGWLPGEFIAETRTLLLPADAPPGEYTLWARMYDPTTRDRLTTSAYPDGRVSLGTVRVGP